ncbi:hypothetical protein BDW75DRAFT_243400 [Aspergillus navahoensis]
MSYPDLNGKTFIVTGAGSGIGRATAKLLGQQGATVAAFDLRAPEAVAQDIKDAGGICLPLECNVQSAEAVNTATEQVVKHFGRLDGAANLAGIAATRKTAVGKFPIESIDDDDWETIMKTNLDGVKNCLRAQFRAITGAGAIVNASSTAGQYGAPNCGPYVVSKWGVIGLTKTVAREVGRRGIRVNAVAPGVVDTNLVQGKTEGRDDFLDTTALGRIAQPEELARVIVFMLSEQASYMTASVVNVDGGYF